MTKSMITFPNERYEMYEKQLAEKDAALAEKETELAVNKAELFAAHKLSNEKDALIADLKRQLEEALAKSK